MYEHNYFTVRPVSYRTQFMGKTAEDVLDWSMTVRRNQGYSDFAEGPNVQDLMLAVQVLAREIAALRG